jgi:Zn-dependent protease with chaperone function
MQRWLVVLITGSLYVAITAWIVQSEGRAYRESMRSRRAPEPKNSIAAASDANPRVLGPLAASKPDNRSGAEPVPAATSHSQPTAPTPVDAGPPLSPGNRPSPRPSADRTTADAPERQTPNQNPSSASTAPTAPASSPAPRSEPPPGPPKELLQWADGLDLSRLSADDERRLGAMLHASIVATNPIWRDGPALKWIEQTAAPILEARAHKDFDYTFTIIDSDGVNAFSHPGGYIYLTRGLLDFIGEGDDFALEFVLAHEIAHLDFQHALKIAAARSAEAKKAGASTLGQFSLFIALGFPDQQEYEADAWAFQQMVVRLDRTKHKALSFLRRFEEYANSRGFGDGHSPPLRGRNITENHFPAHPAAWKRLARLTKRDSPATKR